LHFDIAQEWCVIMPALLWQFKYMLNIVSLQYKKAFGHITILLKSQKKQLIDLKGINMV
jgi:hypothetical protein